MADRLKNKEDLILESMFESAPLRDDGFTVKVESRIRRQIWIRRTSLPVAFLCGLAVCYKPLVQLFHLIPSAVDSLPVEALSFNKLPLDGLPQLPAIVMGAALVAMVMVVGRMLEET